MLNSCTDFDLRKQKAETVITLLWKTHKYYFKMHTKPHKTPTSGYIPDFAHWKMAEGLLEQDVREGQIKLFCLLPVAQVGCEHCSKPRGSLIFLQYTI